MAKRDIREARVPVVTTDGDEIDSTTEIIPRSEADIFSVDWHVRENNIYLKQLSERSRRLFLSVVAPGFPPVCGGSPRSLRESPAELLPRRLPIIQIHGEHVAPGFAPGCGDSPRSLRGEPGTSSFQGGRQSFKFTASM